MEYSLLTLHVGLRPIYSWLRGSGCQQTKKGSVMTRKVSVILGIALRVAGLIGFQVPDFLAMHPSRQLNLIHLISGGLAFYFGLVATDRVLRSFSIVFGSLYGLWGVIGFAGNGAVHYFSIIPNRLMLGSMDPVAHVILAALFLLAGLCREPIKSS